MAWCEHEFALFFIQIAPITLLESAALLSGEMGVAGNSLHWRYVTQAHKLIFVKQYLVRGLLVA